MRRKAAVGVDASMARREVGLVEERPRLPEFVTMSAVEVADGVEVEINRSGSVALARPESARRAWGVVVPSPTLPEVCRITSWSAPTVKPPVAKVDVAVVVCTSRLEVAVMAPPKCAGPLV